MKEIDEYVNQLDWRVKENANTNFSMSGLKSYIAASALAKDSLAKLPEKIRNAHKEGLIHIHDLDGSLFMPYCYGADLQQLMFEGLKNPVGSNSRPAKYLDSVVDHMVNYLYISQSEFNGAQAFSFDSQTPIIIKRNNHIEYITLERLFEDYKHLLILKDKYEVSYLNNAYREFSLINLDKRKYGFDVRLENEPILYQNDRIEIFTEYGFVDLIAISRHKIDSENDKLIHIETENGNLLRVTKSHPIILEDNSIKIAKDVIIGDIIKHSNNIINITGNISLNKDFAYLIGFMIAEGCYGHQTKKLSISQKRNTKEREKIEMVLNNLKIPYTCKSEFNILISTTSVGRFIRNHLQLEEYSYRKNFPSIIFDLDKDSICSIISGYIDGDGCVRKNRNVSIDTTSYTIAVQLKYLLDILHITSTIRQHHPTNKNRDAYTVRFKIEIEYLYLFKDSVKLQGLKFKTKKSTETGYKIIKISNAKSNSEYVYDVTTLNHTFLIGNIVVHNSNVDTLLSPFVVGRSYKFIKQNIQRLIYNISYPLRSAFQSPFVNFSFDLIPPEHMKKEPVVIGGKTSESMVYGDMQPEMDLINKAFLELMLEGDSEGKPFTFPIPTYGVTKELLKKDDSVTDLLYALSAKFGSPNFQNYIGSGNNPSDVRSLCCRLSLDIKKLKSRGLWNIGNRTGSLGVVTINLNHCSKDGENKFIENIDNAYELSIEELTIKSKYINQSFEKGLLPFTKQYLPQKDPFSTFFDTIGIHAMNEACINMFDSTIEFNQDFVVNTLKHLRERVDETTEETGMLFNLEETPAEGATYRLAKLDRKMGLPTQGGKNPYLTNSTHCPVNTIFDWSATVKVQEKFKPFYSGGTIMHGFTGDVSPERARRVIEQMSTDTKIPYYNITPTFSMCQTDGYFIGSVPICPKCNNVNFVYSRVVGYIQPIWKWNDGKQEEAKDRKMYQLG